MEKTEWPNKSRLEELREKGLVHYSLFVSRCAGLAALACTGYVLRTDVARVCAELPSWLRSASPGAPLKPEVWSALIRIWVAAPLAVFIVSYLFGLVQTRFLFRPSSLAPSWLRIYSVSYAPLQVAARVVVALVQGLLAVALGLAAALLLQSEILGLLNGRASMVAPWALSFSLRSCRW